MSRGVAKSNTGITLTSLNVEQYPAVPVSQSAEVCEAELGVNVRTGQWACRTNSMREFLTENMLQDVAPFVGEGREIREGAQT